MKMNTYNLIIEPRDRLYFELLDFAFEECGFFLLVTDRENRQLSPQGKKVLDELFPYLSREELRSEWPGTVLINNKVPVYTYHFTPESSKILKKVASRLYQWQRPELPDDLCLLRPDETPWLVTIGHENDSYFVLTEEEKIRLFRAIPDFETMLEIANG